MTAARKLAESYYYSEEVQPVQSKRRKQKRRLIPVTVKICIIAACCVAVALFYLQLQVTTYNLNIELAHLEEQVNVHVLRNNHLMIELESKRSLQRIEELARLNLGMVDPQQTASLVIDQSPALASTEHGRWIDEDYIQEGSKGFFATLSTWLNKAFPIGGVEAGTLQR